MNIGSELRERDRERERESEKRRYTFNYRLNCQREREREREREIVHFYLDLVPELIKRVKVSCEGIT